MNSISALRPAFQPLANLPALRPDAADLARSLQPGDLKDLATNPASAPASVGRPSEGTFSSLLGRMISEVSNKQQVAGQAVSQMQSGGPVSLHQAMIAMEEASVSFTLMTEVRNKLLESYQELMRMQV